MAKRNSRRRFKQRTSPGSVAEKSKSIDVVEEEAFSITTIAHPHVDQPWPCLVICHGKEKKPVLTFYNVSEHRYHSKVSRECTNKYVHWSHGEWLLLQDATNSSDCCILNVLTMEKVQLPPLDEDAYLQSHGTLILSSSSPTTDANWCAFLINGPRDFNIPFMIGAKQFSRQELNLGSECLIDAIIFQGKMYCITAPSYILFCSEMEDSSPQNIQFREFMNGETLQESLLFHGNRRYYLIESCGQLLFVDQFELGTGVVDFQIFRADLRGKTWERVNNIGDDRAIFADGLRCFSASVTGCGLKGNCIYFVEELDGTLHVYDLEDQSVTMSSPFPFDTQEFAVRWLLISTTNQK